MSYATSILATNSALRKITQHGRPDLSIEIDGHKDGKVYTTFDTLRGKVNITAPFNARFDEIKITLEGSSKTYIENVSQHSTKTVTATHNFLKLVMPVRESDYPQPRIAEAGRTYTFPFNFVIPDNLLPRACSHNTSADHVHQAHLTIPPSLGDPLISLQDDLAPEMSKIHYAVRVKVIRSRERDAKDVVLVESMKNFRVVPAIAEEPPLSVGEGYDQYVLSKTKTLKKGMFSGKLGRISVSAEQTAALMLPAPSLARSPATTMAMIQLRFDPQGDSGPPRLGGLTTKIKATTFYAAKPTDTIPSRGSELYDPARGVYTASVPLSSRCVESVAWIQHTATQRRNSDSSTSSSDYSDSPPSYSNSTKNVYYTTQILVPISLPASKAWIPTFHSCLVSRIYALDLNLSIHTPGTGLASSVSLHLPVQIAQTTNQLERTPLTAAEAAIELAEVNAFFRLRVLEIPRENFLRNSVLRAAPSEIRMPPGYEDFFGGSYVSVEGRS